MTGKKRKLFLKTRHKMGFVDYDLSNLFINLFILFILFHLKIFYYSIQNLHTHTLTFTLES